MKTSRKFPFFDECFPSLNQFILELVEAYNAGKINSRGALETSAGLFFTQEMMESMEVKVPGWKKMTSYSEGITLVHVMCVLLGLFMLPEFQSLMPEQQQLAKWIALFHDVEKVHINGERDYTHAFRSAVTTAGALNRIGFPVMDEFESIFNSWSQCTRSAVTESTTVPGQQISDNRSLPGIIVGIEEMYGRNTPAALIVKGVLLHMSVNVVKDWPQPAPLTDDEIVRYVDKHLAPLLKVMHLADSEGWSIFETGMRTFPRKGILDAFQRVEGMIHRQSEQA